MGPFLLESQKVVCSCNLNGELTAWTRLSRAMLQGWLLGPLTFLVLINDIIECRVHIFIDDTTVTETWLLDLTPV